MFDIGAALNAGSGLIGTLVSGIQNRRALRNQEEQQDLDNARYEDERDYTRDFAEDERDYQRALQETVFDREDTAVQRRAADMQAAGLSRQLAAGGAAATGKTSASPPPPRGQSSGGSAAIDRFDVGRQVQTMADYQAMQVRSAQIAQTKAQTELIKAQAARVAGLLPHELRAHELSNELNNVLNPLRVDQLVIGNNRGRVQLDGDRLANQLTNAKISQADIDRLRSQVDLDIAQRFGMSNADIDNALALTMLLQRQFSYQFGVDRGVPPEFASGMLGTAYSMLSQPENLMNQTGNLFSQGLQRLPPVRMFQIVTRWLRGGNGDQAELNRSIMEAMDARAADVLNNNGVDPNNPSDWRKW